MRTSDRPICETCDCHLDVHLIWPNHTNQTGCLNCPKGICTPRIMKLANHVAARNGYQILDWQQRLLLAGSQMRP